MEMPRVRSAPNCVGSQTAVPLCCTASTPASADDAMMTQQLGCCGTGFLDWLFDVYNAAIVHEKIVRPLGTYQRQLAIFNFGYQSITLEVISCRSCGK